MCHLSLECTPRPVEARQRPGRGPAVRGALLFLTRTKTNLVYLSEQIALISFAVMHIPPRHKLYDNARLY